MKKEDYSYKKLGCAFVLFALAMSLNDAETERCASRAVCPIQRSFMMKQRAPLRLMKAQQVNKLPELLSQKRPQAAAQVRAMQPEPSTLSQTQ